MRMRVEPLLMAFLVAGAACSSVEPFQRGAPCGNAEYASAQVTMPDTGIAAGMTVSINLDQHDPDLAGELTELVIQQVVPQGQEPQTDPDPRIRLLNVAGQVLLDTLVIREPSTYTRTDWFMLHWIHDARERTALYQAFRDGTLILELRSANGSQAGTRVPVSTDRVGVTPPATCL